MASNVVRLNATITQGQKDFLREQVISQGYQNESEFLRSLLRREMEIQRSSEQAYLRDLIAESEASGISPLTPKALRSRLKKTIEKAKSHKQRV